MKTKQEKPRCAGHTHDTVSGLCPCSFAGTLPHDGKLWCKIHHPPSRAGKIEKTREQWRKEWAEEDAIAAKSRARAAILEELAGLAINATYPGTSAGAIFAGLANCGRKLVELEGKQ